MSERHACRVVGQHRSTPLRSALPNPYRDNLVARMRALAIENPRRGRRYVMDLLHEQGWSIGTRRMKRLWRTEGLLVPQKRVKCRRIGHGLNDIVRRRATMKNQVWGMDFIQDRTADGRPFRLLRFSPILCHSQGELFCFIRPGIPELLKQRTPEGSGCPGRCGVDPHCSGDARLRSSAGHRRAT
jgi:transposase InsO family protein